MHPPYFPLNLPLHIVLSKFTGGGGGGGLFLQMNLAPDLAPDLKGAWQIECHTDAALIINLDCKQQLSILLSI